MELGRERTEAGKVPGWMIEQDKSHCKKTDYLELLEGMWTLGMLPTKEGSEGNKAMLLEAGRKEILLGSFTKLGKIVSYCYWECKTCKE